MQDNNTRLSPDREMRVRWTVAAVIVAISLIITVISWIMKPDQQTTLPETFEVSVEPRVQIDNPAPATITVDETEAALQKFGLSKSNTAKISVR